MRALPQETERLEINIEALENQEEEVKIQRSALVESLKPLKGRQAEVGACLHVYVVRSPGNSG